MIEKIKTRAERVHAVVRETEYEEPTMMNDDSEQTELPAIGDEVLVNVTPSVRSDQKWMQVGNVLAVRQDTTGLIVGTIKLVRPMTTEENARGWQTDDRWNSCDVDAVYNQFIRRMACDCARVSDLARAAWAKCWETDCKCDEQQH